MNAILLAALSLLLLYLGYRYYSPVLARQLGIDESEETPAVKQHDGVDFVPAKHWLILFGHHFAPLLGRLPLSVRSSPAFIGAGFPLWHG